MKQKQKQIKQFIVMRGAPGSGKSTFAKKHFPNECIVCPDELRILCYGIVQDENGKEQISQANPKIIWDMTFDLLKESLTKNSITVLDATSTREKDLNKYYKLAKQYGALLVIIDFSSVAPEECKKRNERRLPEYKRVSGEVIDRMYMQLKHSIQGKTKNHIIDYKEYEFYKEGNKDE